MSIAKVTLSVQGMSCGGCVAGVQRALAKVPGLHAAEVQLEAAQATISYDPSQTDPEALAAAITAAGFDAAPAG